MRSRVDSSSVQEAGCRALLGICAAPPPPSSMRALMGLGGLGLHGLGAAAGAPAAAGFTPSRPTRGNSMCALSS